MTVKELVEILKDYPYQDWDIMYHSDDWEDEGDVYLGKGMWFSMRLLQILADTIRYRKECPH